MINDYEATKPMTTDATVYTDVLSNDEVISKLNGLIQICKDGQNGFTDGAEGIESSDLKKVFYEYSQQRAEYSGVLQELVRSLGGTPETGGSVSAAVHRGWMDIKSLVTGKDEAAILNECERGEDFAKEAYNDAMESKLPGNVADILARQRQAIVAAHNHIRMLRDAQKTLSASSVN